MEPSSLEIKPLELKFLLRLLAYAPDYRAPISQIKIKPVSDRNSACKSLCGKGLVEYVEEIQQYRLEAPGKALLKSDADELPVYISTDHRSLLDAAKNKPAKPSDAKKIAPADRQQLLNQLKEKGLIHVTKSQIKDVWLTPHGNQYLLRDYVPVQPRANLTFSLLGYYLDFLRQSFGRSASETAVVDDQPESKVYDPANPSTTAEPTDGSAALVLETIRNLDQQLDTDNFLPIFHLREKLQSTLRRDRLDQLLFELQSQDLIELSTLQDVSNYSETQAAAGIPQPIGGALFYISLIE